MIVRRFKINMIPGGKMAEVALSQYDSDVTLEFELYASDGTFVVESGTTAVFRGSKPDKNGISVAAELESTIDPETGKNIYLVTVDVIPQMTAVAGRSLYELSLQKGGEELNTANFILDIERAPLDADTLPSESVIRELVDVIDKADEIIAAAETVTTAIDDTLTQQGKAADAKKVGDEISDLKADLSHIGLSDDVKTSLLACFSHVAWIDAHGQDYYDALEAALYADSYPRITAIFDAGINVIYTDDALDTLKQYLTVKYFATKESTGTVISSSDYTLSGTLTEGTSTVTVSYEGVRTSVSIPGVIDFYNISSWSYPDGGILIANATAQIFDKIIAQNTFGVPCLNYNSTNRRAPYVTHGKIPFVDTQGNELDGRYPIPVPDGATGITATIVPSSSYLSIRPYQYDDVNGYSNIFETGWKQGTATRAGLDSSLKYFFHINIKYDAAGQSYPTEPTSISITFSFD